MTDDQVFDLVRAELVRARRKFPEPHFMMTAITEEVGELARAVLHKVAPEEPDPYAADDVLKEAVQVISTVVRLVVEGDTCHGLAPSELNAPDDLFAIDRDSHGG